MISSIRNAVVFWDDAMTAQEHSTGASLPAVGERWRKRIEVVDAILINALRRGETICTGDTPVAPNTVPLYRCVLSSLVNSATPPFCTGSFGGEKSPQALSIA